MDTPDHSEIVRLMREARAKDRGYASFFGWSINRDLEELGPVQELVAALAHDGNFSLRKVSIRGRGSDPPDLEALDEQGRRVAIEVTELVDEEAVRAYKAGDRYAYAEWDEGKFLAKLQDLLKSKVARYQKLKGGPYPGGYVIVIFTDEPLLQADVVHTFLAEKEFADLGPEHRAYLLLSYSSASQRCPYFALRGEA